MSLKAKLVAGLGGAALCLIAGSPIASADPDTTAIVNSTCTYPQVMDALRAQSPDVADQVSASGLATGWLQGLVNAPPAERPAMIQQAQAFQIVRDNTPLINQVAYTCKNF